MSDSYEKHRGYRFDAYVLDIDRGALLGNDGELKLRPKSFEVLRYLVERSGKLVSRQELFDTVWSGTVVTDDALTQCLMDIRRALRGSGLDLIKTVPRRGYLFDAEVLPLVDDAAREPRQHPAPPRSVWWAVAAVLVIAFGLALNLLRTSEDPLQSPTGAPASDFPVIAVVPLVNMSSNEENVFFAGGIQEDLLTNLAQVESLRLVSRTTMLSLAASQKSLPEISKQLGVDYLVEGSVRRIGNHVRVTIQLIDVHNDQHLWANNYQRELSDAFTTQSELAREITDSIRLELEPDSVGALEGMPTASVKAYDLYLKAESLEKSEGETEASMVRRRDMLEKAVAEDPDFVEAWAVLKRIYDLQRNRMVARGWYVADGDNLGDLAGQLKAKSQHALNRAAALGPNNVETLLSGIVDHDWPKSPEEMQSQKAVFDQLIDAYPQHAKTWYHLGWWRSSQNLLPGQDITKVEANAAAAFEEALRLDPFNARMVGAVHNWYQQRGYQSDVNRLAERIQQIIPETSDDRSLARVSWAFKKRQIISAFLETADETLLVGYEQGWQEAVDNQKYQIRATQFLDEAEISILIADQNRLAELSRVSFDINQSEYHYVVDTILKSIGIREAVDRADTDAAERAAQRVLVHENAILARGANRCVCYFHDLAQAHDMIGPGALAQAHAVLGNMEGSRNLNEALIEEGGLHPVTRVRILAHIDLERAVDAAFDELAKNSSWNGFDVLAAYYVFNRQLLAHSRVQAHYKNEGKWMSYLAARMPEHYAGRVH